MTVARTRLLWVGAAATLAAMLYRFPPAQHSFYPACPIHRFTGLLCPGCGATRALAALLHGHVQDALHLNAFFVCLIAPCALAYGLLALQRGRWLKPPAMFAWVFAVAALGFTVARNFH